MEKVNRILNNELFHVYLKEIRRIEEHGRAFCGHDLSHLMDVARIAMILNWEENLALPKELIYAAALLHDIGRHMEYRDGIPHEQAGAVLAPQILRACGFDDTQARLIIQAIAGHRSPDTAQAPTLSGLLYRADKLSRPCFNCETEKECDWDRSKKNYHISY